MKRQVNIIKYILTVFLAVFTLFTAALLNAGKPSAYAATTNVVAAYENQNVGTDLQNSTIGD